MCTVTPVILSIPIEICTSPLQIPNSRLFFLTFSKVENIGIT